MPPLPCCHTLSHSYSPVSLPPIFLTTHPCSTDLRFFYSSVLIKHTAMIRFSARGANLLFAANGERLLGIVCLLGTGRLFLFEHIHLNVIKRKSRYLPWSSFDVIQYLDEKRRILQHKNCSNRFADSQNVQHYVQMRKQTLKSHFRYGALFGRRAPNRPLRYVCLFCNFLGRKSLRRR